MIREIVWVAYYIVTDYKLVWYKHKIRWVYIIFNRNL